MFFLKMELGFHKPKKTLKEFIKVNAARYYNGHSVREEVMLRKSDITDIVKGGQLGGAFIRMSNSREYHTMEEYDDVCKLMNGVKLEKDKYVDGTFGVVKSEENPEGEK